MSQYIQAWMALANNMNSLTHLEAAPAPDPFPYTPNPEGRDIFLIHAKWLTILWTFCDIPILIGRYAKGWRYSYKVHSVSMSIVLMTHLLLVTMNIVNVQMSTGRGNNSVRHAAHWKGIVCMISLSFALAFTGTILESYYKARNSKISLQKPILRKFHVIFGIMMWVAAKYTIHAEIDFLGISWVETSYKIGRWVVIFFVLAMEFYRVKLKKRDVSRKVIPKKITQDQRIIVEKLRSGATSEELKADYPDKSIFMFKHLIYDLTGYTHPGGDIIFVNHNFKEISRYVMGTHPDEHENFPAFIHSQAAY